MGYSPKYLQLAYDLQTKICDGQYKSSERLPTEKEIATSYSLSRQTVRQALSYLVEHGYIRRVQGSGSYVTYRSPEKSASNQIAIITTYISEYIFPSILRGIEEIAAESGYSISIYATNNSITTERQILTALLNSPVDGIIAEGTKTALPNPNVALYHQMADNGTPIVFFNGNYPSLEHKLTKYVLVDDYGGGKDAVRRMVEKGHRAIGGIFKSDDIQGTQRFAGFIDGLLQYGAEMNDRRTIWFSTETKNTFLKNISDESLSALRSCTALLCYNDEIAMQLMPLLEDSLTNLRSIISFDRNMPIPISTTIDFFSVGHPKEEIGRIAMSKLLQMLRGESVSSVVLPWKY